MSKGNEARDETKMTTKRINWSSIKNESRRNELKQLARKMRSKGYTKIQLNFHGAGTYSIDGFNAAGGVWIA